MGGGDRFRESIRDVAGAPGRFVPATQNLASFFVGYSDLDDGDERGLVRVFRRLFPDDFGQWAHARRHEAYEQAAALLLSRVVYDPTSSSDDDDGSPSSVFAPPSRNQALERSEVTLIEKVWYRLLFC